MSYRVELTFYQNGTKKKYDLSMNNKVILDFFYTEVVIDVYSQYSRDFIDLTWNNYQSYFRLTRARLQSDEINGTTNELSGIAKDHKEKKDDETYYHHYSHQCSEKDFIGFLLFGVFNIVLIDGEEKYIVGKILRTKFVGIEGKSYKYFENILNSVMKSWSSLIFSIVNKKSIFQFSPSRNADIVEVGQLLRLAENYLIALHDLNSFSISIPCLVSSKREIERVSPHTRLDGEAIRSISKIKENRKYLNSSIGIQSFSSHSRVKVSVAETIDSYDIEENQILYCQGKKLLRLIEIISNRLIFDIPYFSKLQTSLVNQLNIFSVRCSLSDLIDTPYSPPLKYLYSEDPKLREIGLLMQRCNYLGIPENEEDRFFDDFTIPTTDKLWEFFCLDCICRAISQLGYTTCEILEGSLKFTSPSSENNLIEIYYDCSIRAGDSVGYVENIDSTPKQPDYLILYKTNDVKKAIVLDAKFTIDRNGWRQRSSKIWSQYGLWLRKEGYETIDLCYALVPSTTKGEIFSSHEETARTSRLDLGFLSLMMDEHDESGIELIKDLFRSQGLSG